MSAAARTRFAAARQVMFRMIFLDGRRKIVSSASARRRPLRSDERSEPGDDSGRGGVLM